MCKPSDGWQHSAQPEDELHFCFLFSFVGCQAQNNQNCKAMWRERISSFLKPSVEMNHCHRQEVLAFPQSLLSVRAQPQVQKQRHPEMGLGFNNSRTEEVSCLRLWERNQSAWVLMRQATSRTYNNASGPVPCLTVCNPLSAQSVTSSFALLCIPQVPGLFSHTDELHQFYHTLYLWATCVYPTHSSSST